LVFFQPLCKLFFKKVCFRAYLPPEKCGAFNCDSVYLKQQIYCRQPAKLKIVQKEKGNRDAQTGFPFYRLAKNGADAFQK